ncbi:MAG: DUF3000 domain-containing protein [Actinomycetes bacterium]
MRTISSKTDAFDRALAQVKTVSVRPEFEIDESPAPLRLAPSAVALTADMSDPDDASANGRFVLLHDPDGVDEWDGSFRAVVFARANLEADLVDDPMLHDVGWSWVTEAITNAGAHATQLGGTITRSSGRSFGTMTDRPGDGYVEIRASWTPVEDPETGEPVDDLALHVTAWLDLLAQAAGLPPLPQGITHVGTMRRKHRG